MRPPGGGSNISLGADEEKPPVRKNKMASSVFAEPEDPYANRRNNPPGTILLTFLVLFVCCTNFQLCIMSISAKALAFFFFYIWDWINKVCCDCRKKKTPAFFIVDFQKKSKVSGNVIKNYEVFIFSLQARGIMT